MNYGTPENLIIAGLYYLLTGGLCFFSIFGVYVLIRFARNTLLALVISLVFSLFFLTILSESHQTLSKIISFGA
jgi:hypothetical protein